MKSILSNSEFDIERDIVLIRKKLNDDDQSPYTTENTLLKLEYDTTDVIEELLQLTVGEYYETIIDQRASEERIVRFFVFGRMIQGKMVYIKVRIKQNKMREFVFCISFHFAGYPMMKFPYANR